MVVYFHTSIFKLSDYCCIFLEKWYKTEDFEAELTHILEQICQAEGWKYAEVWIPDGRVLRCHASHYMASEQLGVFRNESEEFIFTAGSGLPGRVWMLETPEWIENVTLEPAIYYRSDIAKKVGLKAALGVPILAKGEVIAVVAFYRDEAQPPNESLIAECCDRIQSLIAP